MEIKKIEGDKVKEITSKEEECTMGEINEKVYKYKQTKKRPEN